MGILSKLFGNKKTYEVDEQHKEQGKRKFSPVLPTLMHDEPASLAKYVDKKIPVLIIGGKYHQTQVVLPSNPSEKKFTASNGKAYPGVTIGMVMGTGCTALFLIQTVVFILENLGGVGNMGIYCPFFGTGRSGMLTSYILLGLLLSICRYQKTAPEPAIRSWRWGQRSQS